MLMAISPLDAFKLYYEELPSDKHLKRLAKLRLLKGVRKNAKKS